MLSTMSSAAARAARPVLARNMSAITGVNGRYIIDSRGNPTVEVRDYIVDKNNSGTAETMRQYGHAATT